MIFPRPTLLHIIVDMSYVFKINSTSAMSFETNYSTLSLKVTAWPQT